MAQVARPSMAPVSMLAVAQLGTAVSRSSFSPSSLKLHRTTVHAAWVSSPLCCHLTGRGLRSTAVHHCTRDE